MIVISTVIFQISDTCLSKYEDEIAPEELKVMRQILMDVGECGFLCYIVVSLWSCV